MTTYLYDVLHQTSTSFVRSTASTKPGTNEMDPTAILALCTDDFEISWGHAYFVSTQPHLQQILSAQGFIDHVNRITPLLRSVDVHVTDIMVDAVKKSAVVRADFRMFAKTDESTEGVLNELIFWIQMDDGGRKVRKVVEFVDASATSELKRRMT